jgi:hypothetical protein
MLWRMAAEPRLDRIGIMLARRDDLPQRHRSVTLHVATPDVDFRTSMRWGSMCSRDDPGSRNSPFPACHAKPLTIGISLAEIAGIANSWQQQQASAEPRDWPKRLRKLRKPPPWPARWASRQKLGWCGKGGNPFFSYIDTKVFLWDHWVEKWHDRRTAHRLFGGPMGIAGHASYGAHLLRGAVAKPCEPSENSQSFQCGKAANPGLWCLLIPAFCVPKFRS